MIISKIIQIGYKVDYLCYSKQTINTGFRIKLIYMFVVVSKITLHQDIRCYYRDLSHE